MSERQPSEVGSVPLELDELEVPVVSLHPAFGEARGANGQLRVRTDLRAGRGNIVQAYPDPQG